jgi:hypothetical protein
MILCEENIMGFMYVWFDRYPEPAQPPVGFSRENARAVLANGTTRDVDTTAEDPTEVTLGCSETLSQFLCAMHADRCRMEITD